MPAPRVASIHIHPPKAGDSMVPFDEVELVAEKGIVQDQRYYGRLSRSGEPSRRQLTLMEREQIASHAKSLGCSGIEPGAVRSNIETEGIDLVPLTGKTIQIGGSAKVLIGAPRDPCEKMDEIMPGLRALMDDDRQGVVAQVMASGTIRVGDSIQVLSDP